MRQPFQVILFNESKTVLIAASGSSLFVIDLVSNAVLNQVTDHVGMIRYLGYYQHENKEFIISTGEDKLLIVYELSQKLVKLSTRTLNKRANALKLTNNQHIVIGDKFGDVFNFPLIAPDLPPLSADQKPIPYQPILGGVPMLTDLIFIQAKLPEITMDYVVSADRDEHVRVSRYPNGYIIDKFLFGNTKFLTSLLYIETDEHSTIPLIVTAGGDTTIQTFNLITGQLISSTDIESLFPFVIVAPIPPPAISIGRKVNARARKAALGKGKGKATEADDTSMTEATETEGVDEEGESAVVKGPYTQKPPGAGLSIWMDGKTMGLAILKMVQMGSRAEGGLVISAAGGTALLYIPIASLTTSASESPAAPILLDLKHPILDFTLKGSIIYVSLDLSRGAEAGEEDSAIRRVAFNEGVLAELPVEAAEKLITLSTSSVTAEASLPPPASLFPTLSLLIQPDDDEVLMPVEKKAKQEKKPAAGSVLTKPEASRTGKRAKGRATIAKKLGKAAEKNAQGESKEMIVEPIVTEE